MLGRNSIMTRTIRNRKGITPFRDGKITRGCGDKNCTWCKGNRTNKRQREDIHFGDAIT